MDAVRIVDEFLPHRYLDEVLDLTNNRLVWTWVPETDYPSEAADRLWDKQMVASIIYDSQRVSAYCDFIYPITYLIEEKFGIKVGGVLRLKINKTFTCRSDVRVQAWHVDGYTPNVKSVVIYLDESDGGTTISSSRMEQETNSAEENRRVAEEGEQHYVAYVPNRAVLFDSQMLHFGDLPTRHKCRTVMNIVFLEGE